MSPRKTGKWRVVAVALFGAVLFTSCASTTPGTASSPTTSSTALSEDDDESQLIAQLRGDLSRYNSREIARTPNASPNTTSARSRDTEFANRARALFAPLNGSAMRIPVVGVRSRDLSDSWHHPRDGGSRVHKGIDIFAPKGTEIVAVADGFISFLGDQRLGGHCVWLTTENGTSFYYAHLDRWAPGLYEGMEVQSGDLLGYVGNTGNARTTPPHLHFGINQNDEMINPYPVLNRAVISMTARNHVTLGGGYGTR